MPRTEQIIDNQSKNILNVNTNNIRIINEL